LCENQSVSYVDFCTICPGNKEREGNVWNGYEGKEVKSPSWFGWEKPSGYGHTGSLLSINFLSPLPNYYQTQSSVLTHLLFPMGTGFELGVSRLPLEPYSQPFFLWFSHAVSCCLLWAGLWIQSCPGLRALKSQMWFLWTQSFEPHLQYILIWLLWRWALMNYLPRLPSNFHPPNLSLPSG
jgi:hypothetical protein